MKKPEIVILDGHAVNPGDLAFDALAALGDLTEYDYCTNDAEEIVKRCGKAEIVITNKMTMNEKIFSSLPELKFISVLATGYDTIDCAAAKKHGITVCNVPKYSTDSVAQLVFAFILSFFSGTAEQSEAVRQGLWSKSKEFTLYVRHLNELAGKTLGIFGFGAIGRKVGEIGRSFGMRVTYNCRKAKDDASFAEFVSAERLFAESDVVTLHAPLTPETKCIVNARTLSLMKKTAFLINTARGGLVDEHALADALNSGKIAGAALDVLAQEPPKEDNELIRAKNCMVTPHVAWATVEARQRLLDETVKNVKAYLDGKCRNVVNA